MEAAKSVRIKALIPGTKLCEENPMDISSMKQGLRKRRTINAKRVSKP